MAKVDIDRIVVGGHDLYEEFGAIYVRGDGSHLGPPAVRTNYLEIPAMDGVLDATEMWTDDVVYGNRESTVELFIDTDRDFMTVESALSNLLDGRRFDYTYSFDPGYVYNGRFKVEDFDRYTRRINLSIDANPWKRGGSMHYDINGAGGTTQVIFNARRHVGPIVTVEQPTIVKYPADAEDARTWIIEEAGPWRIDARLQEGYSRILVNSAPDLCDTTVDEFVAMCDDCTLDEIRKGSLGAKRLTEFYLTHSQKPTDAKYKVGIDYDLYYL